MLNKDLIIEKINLISRDIAALEKYQDYTIQDMAEDFLRYSALKNILMETIGRAIDINNHLIVELCEPASETPKTYRETFMRLGDLGVLPKDFANRIAQSAGFRNAIVHEYNNLDKSLVFNTVGDAISQYAEYCQLIKDFIEKQ